MIIDFRKIPTVWINLDSATENAKLMEERFRQHRFEYTFRKSARQIAPPPNTPDVIKHYVGCAQSHIDVLEDMNYSCPLLILEDDSEFTPDFHPMIEVPDNTDAVYLGVSSGNPHYITKQVNKYFMRIGKIIYTPKITHVGIKGVTRELILKVSAGLGFKIKESTFTLNKLLASDEVFITNSLFGVLQVKKIKNKSWQRQELASLFNQSLKHLNI